MSKLLVALFFLLSCGSYRTSKTTPVPSLEDRASTYIAQMETDEHGFILTDKCDSLLFSSLLAAARPSLNINILAARDEDGAWHRRPNKDCNPEIGNSRSSISRDMILGVMWWAWRTKNLKVISDLYDSLNSFTLPGTGDGITRTLPPAMFRTLLLLRQALGGSDAYFVIGQDYLSKSGGYIAHLAVLHILLRGEIEGYIIESHYELLKYHAEREPKNPLFVGAWAKYSGQNQEHAISLLDMFGEKVPTTDNWCSEWIIERDYGSDWQPCSSTEGYKKHTGAELLVILGLVYGS